MITILIAAYATAGVLSIALLDYRKKTSPLTRSTRGSAQPAAAWFPSSLPQPQ